MDYHWITTGLPLDYHWITGLPAGLLDYHWITGLPAGLLDYLLNYWIKTGFFWIIVHNQRDYKAVANPSRNNELSENL